MTLCIFLCSWILTVPYLEILLHMTFMMYEWIIWKNVFSFTAHSHKLLSCMIWGKNNNNFLIIMCALEILLFSPLQKPVWYMFYLLSINKMEDQRNNLAKLTQHVNSKTISWPGIILKQIAKGFWLFFI